MFNSTECLHACITRRRVPAVELHFLIQYGCLCYNKTKHLEYLRDFCHRNKQEDSSLCPCTECSVNMYSPVCQLQLMELFNILGTFSKQYLVSVGLVSHLSKAKNNMRRVKSQPNKSTHVFKSIQIQYIQHICTVSELLCQT